MAETEPKFIRPADLLKPQDKIPQNWWRFIEEDPSLAPTGKEIIEIEQAIVQDMGLPADTVIILERTTEGVLSKLAPWVTREQTLAIGILTTAVRDAVGRLNSGDDPLTLDELIKVAKKDLLDQGFGFPRPDQITFPHPPRFLTK